MKIKKIATGIVASIMAFTAVATPFGDNLPFIGDSAVSLTAHAKSETCRLTVSLLDFNISDQPIYPSTVRGDELYDFELTLKSGTKYKGKLSGSEVIFDDVTPDFEGAKISYKTDRSKIAIPDNVNISWSVYDRAKEQWSASEAAIDTHHITKELTKEYEEKLSQVKNRDELEALTPEYTGNYLYAIAPTTEPSGFGSVMLAEMPYATTERLDNYVFIEDRETYRLKDVIDTTMTVGNTSVPCYYDEATGSLYFSFPKKCSGKIKITVSGYYDGTDTVYRTQFTLDGEPVGGYYSADNFVFVAGVDSEYYFNGEVIPDDPDDTDDPIAEAPSAIKGVKLGGRAADALRINWTKNANADGYIVEMYQGNKWVRVAKITNNNTTTFRKAGLKASTVYKFRVKAYKMSGKTALYGNYSATVAARTNPSVIKGAKLTGRAADALRINWTKNASADGYIVEMYQGNKWVRVAKITSNNTTTFKKSGLKASSVYKFRVMAYKMSGSTALYGNYSATVTTMTNPSVIKGAKLTGRAADALRINWTKNTTADGYIVEMYQGNKWVRAGKITNNSTTTFRKAGLKASTVYKFRVRAYKMSGKTALYGNYSATVAARTNPSAVKGVKIAGKAKDALRVNWTKNSSAQGYIVEMYKGGKWVRVAKITNGNTTTYRKAGLAKNTAYKFRVKAYYMSGKTALYGNYGSVSGKTAAK